MANDINQCNFTGNLTADAEMKYSSNGTAICSFSIAVNKKFKDNEQVSFFNFTIFGKFAEAVNQYLSKGLPVAIGAEARQESWESNGQKRHAVKFIVNSLRMFGNKGNGGNNSGGNSGNQGYNQNQGQQNRSNQQNSGGGSFGPEDFEDEIPF